MLRKRNEIILDPGDFYWGKAPEKIITVLGSCVSITVWNPLKKTGGMCHFLLPDSPEAGDVSTRYCSGAVEEIVRNAARESVPSFSYQVKIFGGSMILDTSNNIGSANIAEAEHRLMHAGFTILSRHSGGDFSRRIIFELESGDVWVKSGKSGFIANNTEIKEFRARTNMNTGAVKNVC